MKFSPPNNLRDISLSGLDPHDLISLINRNKFDLEIGKRSVVLVNPKKRPEIKIAGPEITFANEEIILYLLGQILYTFYLSSKDLPTIFYQLRQINDINKFMKAEQYFFYVCNVHEHSWKEIFNSSDKEGYFFFQIFTAFADTVEYKSVDPEIVIWVIRENYGVLKSDGAFGSLLNAINLRAAADKAWAQKFFEVVLKETDEIVYAVMPNLARGISNSQGNGTLLPFISKKIKSKSLPEIKLGIMCLGFMHYSLKNDVKKLEKIIKDLKADEFNNDEIQTLLVMAVTNLMDTSVECQILIKELSESNSLSIRPAVAFCLFKHVEAHGNSQWYKDSAILLARHGTSDNPSVHWLKMALSQLAVTNSDLFNCFFEELIISEGFDFNQCTSYANQFTYYYNNNKSDFKLLISTWFNNDDLRYQFFLEKILREFFILNYNRLELDVNYCNSLPDADLIYVINKVVGFVNNQVSQTYLLLSCIQDPNRPQYIFEFIYNIFIDHICYNYPSTNELLESISHDYPLHIQNLITSIITDSRDYFQKRRELTPLKELNSSEVRAKLFASIRNKQMQDAYEDARGNRSFFMNMVKNISLKGGEFWFSKNSGKYGKKAPLSTFEHGMEMPRGEFIDPLGQSLIRRKFRAYIRKK